MRLRSSSGEPSEEFARGWLWALAAVAVLILLAWVGSITRHSRLTERTFRIGYNDSYPYYSKANDGRPEGFAFEAVDEAANRKGIRLEWVHVTAGPETAFEKFNVDLWPRMASSEERLSK